jgi:hypothetical protein
MTPLQAIRKYCVWCCCDQPAEVRLRPAVKCPLYAYRHGTLKGIEKPSPIKGDPWTVPELRRLAHKGRGAMRVRLFYPSLPVWQESQHLHGYPRKAQGPCAETQILEKKTLAHRPTWKSQAFSNVIHRFQPKEKEFLYHDLDQTRRVSGEADFPQGPNCLKWVHTHTEPSEGTRRNKHVIKEECYGSAHRLDVLLVFAEQWTVL